MDRTSQTGHDLDYLALTGALHAMGGACSDACLAPVNTFLEAPHDPHLAARGTCVEAFGVVQPAPPPRFSRTPGRIAGSPPSPRSEVAGPG